MPWHLLPPLSPEECRYRSAADGDSAVCGVVRAAVPDAAEAICRVARETCLACCRAAPATLKSWNPVVGSLIYGAATAVLRQPALCRAVRARAAAAQRATLRYLVCVPSPPGADAPGSPMPKTIPAFESLRALIPPPAKRRPEPIRKWAVGVTTAPRVRPTLETCLDSLARAGWEAPHLFIDSGVRVPERFGHLPGTLRRPAAGAWPNHYLALSELTLRHPEADAYLIVQDDALFYAGENMRLYLEQALWPQGPLPVISLFCPEPYTARRFGWHRYRWSWVWGAQAFILPRDVARLYLRDRWICRHRWDRGLTRARFDGLALIDVLLGRWLRRRRIPLWYPTPSLVQHIGDTSTLWLDSEVTGARAASLFAGNRADA